MCPILPYLPSDNFTHPGESAATQYVIIEYSFFIMRSNAENVMLDEI